MDCGDTIKCIERFVNHDLTPREMEGFLDHVAECQDCYENRKILRRCIGVFLVLWLAGLVWFLISVQLPDIYAFLPFGV